MKTLDEVIKALEECMADDAIESEGVYLAADALHYLKKLKRIEERMERIALGNIEDTLSKMDNPPLTWEQLKQMEGKPVWFTDKSSPYITVTSWMLIHYYYVTSTGEEGIFAHDFTGGTAKIINKDYGEGKTWQAYRKERE